MDNATFIPITVNTLGLTAGFQWFTNSWILNPTRRVLKGGPKSQFPAQFWFKSQFPGLFWSKSQFLNEKSHFHTNKYRLKTCAYNDYKFGFIVSGVKTPTLPIPCHMGPLIVLTIFWPPSSDFRIPQTFWWGYIHFQESLKALIENAIFWYFPLFDKFV